MKFKTKPVFILFLLILVFNIYSEQNQDYSYNNIHFLPISTHNSYLRFTNLPDFEIELSRYVKRDPATGEVAFYIELRPNDNEVFSKLTNLIAITSTPQGSFPVMNPLKFSIEKAETYTLQIQATNEYGLTIKSNTIDLPIPEAGSVPLSGQNFITLSDPNETLALRGEVIDVYGYPSTESSPVEEIASQNGIKHYKFNESGYYRLSVLERDASISSLFVFISPWPAVINENANLNWYRGQYHTGTTSNCSLSSVSMSIGWAKEQYVPVIDLRKYIGWDTPTIGAVNLNQQLHILEKFDVNAEIRTINSAQDIYDVLDEGGIVIFGYNVGPISVTDLAEASDDLTGKYYIDDCGHYSVISGYTTDGRYFLVQDPLPADWFGNNFRYNDGISMIGRNRYFSVPELMRSLVMWQMIAIFP